MRKKIVAGNWKMNTNLQEGIELAKAVAAKSVETPENVGLIVAATSMRGRPESISMS